MATQLKPGSGPLDYGNRLWLKSLFVVIYIMLYVPIITLIAFSFNTDKRGKRRRLYITLTPEK